MNCGFENLRNRSNVLIIIYNNLLIIIYTQQLHAIEKKFQNSVVKNFFVRKRWWCVVKLSGLNYFVNWHFWIVLGVSMS